MKDNASETQLIRIWSLAVVVNQTGLCRGTIYNRIKSGNFPDGMNFNGRDVGFFADDVEAWMAEQPSKLGYANATLRHRRQLPEPEY